MQKNKVKVAIEIEGSIDKKNYLIMQRPREYSEFLNTLNQVKLD